jgi:hypothetical protein
MRRDRPASRQADRTIGFPTLPHGAAGARMVDEIGLDEWVTAHSAAAWIVTRDQQYSREKANKGDLGLTIDLVFWMQENAAFADPKDWSDLLLAKCKNGKIRATGQASKKQHDIAARQWRGLRFDESGDQLLAKPIFGRDDVPSFTMLEFNRDDLFAAFPRYSISSSAPPQFDTNATRWPLAAALVMIANRDLERVAAAGNGTVMDADIHAETMMDNEPEWRRASEAFPQLQEALFAGHVSCVARRAVESVGYPIEGQELGHSFPPKDRPGLIFDLLPDSRSDKGDCLVPVGSAGAHRREIWFELKVARDDVLRLWPPVAALAEPGEDVTIADVSTSPMVEHLGEGAPSPSVEPIAAVVVEIDADAIRLKAVKMVKDAAVTNNPARPFISKKAGASLLLERLDQAEIAVLWPSGTGRQQLMREFIGSITGSDTTAGRRRKAASSTTPLV